MTSVEIDELSVGVCSEQWQEVSSKNIFYDNPKTAEFRFVKCVKIRQPNGRRQVFFDRTLRELLTKLGSEGSSDQQHDPAEFSS